jgi:hypothetical protein
VDFEIDVTPIFELGIGLDAAAKAVVEQTQIAMTRAVLPVERAAKQLAPVYRGQLRQSITHKVMPIASGVAGEVGTNLSYAKAVEEGGHPRPVSYDAIKKWAIKKGLNPDFAWWIKQAIESVGTLPHPYLIPALEQQKAAIDKEFSMVIPRALKALRSS